MTSKPGDSLFIILSGCLSSAVTFALLSSAVPAKTAAPPEPACNAPARLTASFDGWALIEPRDEARGLPARWEGVLHLCAGKHADAPAHSIEHPRLALPDSPPLAIAARLRPAD